MDNSTVSVNIRMNRELKKEMEELCQDLGMNLTTAFTIFAKTMVRRQQIPFTISRDIPNQETLEAIEEAREMKKHPERYKGYTDVDQMFKEILEEDV